MDAQQAAPQGLIAGKYRITRLVGRGGMGTVWEGVHVTLGTRVAIKFVDSSLTHDAGLKNRFANEAQAAARLRTKHVVQVFDYGALDDGRSYIVMEFLSGEPLDRRLARLGRLSPEETTRIVLQVCRALTKAHAAGIVHRDLKPENIFLVWDEDDSEDIVKVVDFGIAKFTGGSAPTASATRTGSMLGTPFYMSPEQARGLKTIDFRTDLWSLGVVAYECIVGALPFQGEAVGDLVVKICTEPLPIPAQHATGVPPGFDAWFSKALEREPGDRFASAAELAEALAAACGVSVRAGQPREISSDVQAPAVTDLGSAASARERGDAGRTGEALAVGRTVHTQSGGISRLVLAAAVLLALGILVFVFARSSPANRGTAESSPPGSAVAPEGSIRGPALVSSSVHDPGAQGHAQPAGSLTAPAAQPKGTPDAGTPKPGTAAEPVQVRPRRQSARTTQRRTSSTPRPGRTDVDLGY